MTRILLIAILACLPLPGAPASLALRIRAAIEASSVARSAFWGVEVVDLQTSLPLVKLNSDHFFVPASNTKLFTTALALTRLGPDFRVKTTVLASPSGDLTLIGAGDANLSGRTIPYALDAKKEDCLAAMADLAAQIFQRGIRQVGNVTGDDSSFVWDPYAPGWGLDDPLGSDGAPVSSLAVNDNLIALTVKPGPTEGSPLQVSFEPPLALFTIENRALTIAPGKRAIHVERPPGSSVLQIWGSMPMDDAGTTIQLSVDDPARFAALALMEAMKRQGITVTGQAYARHALKSGPPLPAPTGDLVAERLSPPLLEDLRVTDKVSQNLHAEMLLRLVGQGTREGGLEEMNRFATSAGIALTDFSFRDGSGLSRHNVLTPHAVTTLLTHMAKTPGHEAWEALLPVAGIDGSLRMRFTHTRAQGRLSGKTGSLTHVSALSGYATRRDGRRIAYSILVNNYNGNSAAIRDVIDKIGSLLVN